MLISWASQKQKTVALSSCEVEYVAAIAAASHRMWLYRLVSELSGIDETMVKFLVNMSAIVLTKNPLQHIRTKHIDTYHHFIRHYVEDKKIQLVDIDAGRVINSTMSRGLRGNLGLEDLMQSTMMKMITP